MHHEIVSPLPPPTARARLEMDSDPEDSRLQHLYLTGVKSNGNEIGVGAFGRVFEVEYCGRVYAAKEVHSILVHGVRTEDFNAAKRTFLSECIQSSMVSHPNIVHMLGVYNPGGQSLLPVLVMERMQGSLTAFVGKYVNIPLRVKLSILLDVSEGLWYLHSHDLPIVHRDLSPNNILLNKRLVAKISDLGVAKVINTDSKKTKTRAPGTVDFMPPEALQIVPEYGPSLDVFSYGGVILHVVNQEWPEPLHFVVTDPNTRQPKALTEVERRQEHIGRITGTPADLLPLVKQCLDNDPSLRPPISQVSERMRTMKHMESEKDPHTESGDLATLQIQQSLEVSLKVSQVAVQKSHADIFSSTVNVKWREVAPLPVHCTAAIAVLLHGVVYVGGGREGKNEPKVQDSFRVDVYNVCTNQWSPNPIITPYFDFGMTTLDGTLVIAGGETKSGEITGEVFVLDTGEWKLLSKMPTPRSNLAAIGYQSMLITVGGVINSDRKWTRLCTTELLNTADGHWYTCDNLPSPHSQLQGVVVGETLYLLGGRSQDTTSSQVFAAPLNALQSHQIKWQCLCDTTWYASTPAAVFKTYLLTVGGRTQSDHTAKTNEVCAFNPLTQSWVPVAKIPVARSRVAVVGVADNKIICIGGAMKQTSNNHYSNTVWVGTFEDV